MPSISFETRIVCRSRRVARHKGDTEDVYRLSGWSTSSDLSRMSATRRRVTNRESNSDGILNEDWQIMGKTACVWMRGKKREVGQEVREYTREQESDEMTGGKIDTI
jgi:hypothetical protein